MKSNLIGGLVVGAIAALMAVSLLNMPTSPKTSTTTPKLGVAVTPANMPEREGAMILLKRVLAWFLWLRVLWADGGYSGPDFANQVRQLRPKLRVEVVPRLEQGSGFKVLRRRWVVERTFGWLMKQRRLVRDYEATESSAEAMLYISMIRIMLRRLA